MNVRHLATKSFDGDIFISNTIMKDGEPEGIEISSGRIKKTDHIHSDIDFRDYKTAISIIENNENIQNGYNHFLNHTPVSTEDIREKSLEELLKINPDFVTGNQKNNELYRELYHDTLNVMFPDETKNLVLSLANASADEYEYRMASLVLTLFTGILTPQVDETGKTKLNYRGTVSIAEFLDSLNAIKYGANANNRRKKTLDRISNESDYFNEGYRDCVRDITAPFFNLYTRSELTMPITRMEVAYILMICWSRFVDLFKVLQKKDNEFYLGYSFDWENPAAELEKFEDGFSYKVTKCTVNREYDVVSLDLKDYGLPDRTMKEYISDMEEGKSAIPMPLFMSLVEIIKLNCLSDKNNKLNPFDEITRLELSCLLLGLVDALK